MMFCIWLKLSHCPCWIFMCTGANESWVCCPSGFCAGWQGWQFCRPSYYFPFFLDATAVPISLLPFGNNTVKVRLSVENESNKKRVGKRKEKLDHLWNGNEKIYGNSYFAKMACVCVSEGDDVCVCVCVCVCVWGRRCVCVEGGVGGGGRRGVILLFPAFALVYFSFFDLFWFVSISQMTWIICTYCQSLKHVGQVLKNCFLHWKVNGAWNSFEQHWFAKLYQPSSF